MLRTLIGDDRAGEAQGGLGYAEVELDAPGGGTGELATRYLVTSVPTLLAFSRGEAQLESKTADGHLLRDREWVRAWLAHEARRGGKGGGGGSLLGNLFGW